jgi:hypothetical protein
LLKKSPLELEEKYSGTIPVASSVEAEVFNSSTPQFEQKVIKPSSIIRTEDVSMIESSNRPPSVQTYEYIQSDEKDDSCKYERCAIAGTYSFTKDGKTPEQSMIQDTNMNHPINSDTQNDPSMTLSPLKEAIDALLATKEPKIPGLSSLSDTASYLWVKDTSQRVTPSVEPSYDHTRWEFKYEEEKTTSRYPKSVPIPATTKIEKSPRAAIEPMESITQPTVFVESKVNKTTTDADNYKEYDGLRSISTSSLNLGDEDSINRMCNVTGNNDLRVIDSFESDGSHVIAGKTSIPFGSPSKFSQQEKNKQRFPSTNDRDTVTVQAPSVEKPKEAEVKMEELSPPPVPLIMEEPKTPARVHVEQETSKVISPSPDPPQVSINSLIEKLPVAKRLNALSTLTERVEEAAFQGENLGKSGENHSSIDTKEELLRFVSEHIIYRPLLIWISYE